MHGGFGDMRGDMPMNCRAHYPGRGLTQAAMTDIARIDALWCDCRMRFGAGGDFLFGGFTIADVMFAPVASRFVTYEPALSPTAKAYVDAMNAHPAMVEHNDVVSMADGSQAVGDEDRRSTANDLSNVRVERGPHASTPDSVKL